MHSLAPAENSWLVALDIDGTLLTHRGDIAKEVRDEVLKTADRGHEVMLATGRSLIETLPVVYDLGIWPEYLVCSNGAMLLKRDPLADSGYSTFRVETFNPAKVLQMIKEHIPAGRYAVEDETGQYYFTETFPGVDPIALAHKVEFEDLLHHQATRVVVVSPDHELEDFLQIVERVGLTRVSYAIGWMAWLDIAPEGVNKSTGLETVREALGYDRSRVLAVGDGHNDVQMIEWAASLGRGIAMGNATDDVKESANEVCGHVNDMGLRDVLASLP